MSFTLFSVPDQRFTGGYSLKDWECQPIIMANFTKNYMKMKKKLDQEGGSHPKQRQLDPPMVRRFLKCSSKDTLPAGKSAGNDQMDVNCSIRQYFNPMSSK